MDPIIENLPEVRLSSESKEADKVRRVAAQFWLSQDRSLYKRSFGGPYLLCLHPFKINDLLTELLKGYVATTLGAVAGSLSDDPRVLVAKPLFGYCVLRLRFAFFFFFFPSRFGKTRLLFNEQ